MMTQLPLEFREIILANNYEILHSSLRTLKPQQQIVLQLRFWEEHSIAEIASILKTSWDEIDQLIESTLCELNQKLTELKSTKWPTLTAA